MPGQQNVAGAGVRNRHSFAGKGINDETLGVAAKQFGLGKFKIFHRNRISNTLYVDLIYALLFGFV